MSVIYQGGIPLGSIVILFVMFVFFVTNWARVYKILFNGIKLKLEISESFISSLDVLKIVLLKFSGASINDIKAYDGRYVTTINLNDTYFSQHKVRCFWQFLSYYIVYSFIMVFFGQTY